MSRRARPPITALEAALGHVFADKTLLDQALTHISALAVERRMASYQRLEFLGDRVLGLAIADMLFTAFPDDEEGALSRRLSDLVRKETCASVALAWGVGPHLRLGPGEIHSGGRKRLTILGDACEALIGAVFLDAGYPAARAVVECGWKSRLLSPPGPLSDAKTTLQEWAQARALAAPTYRVVSRTGPDHSPRFVVAVDIDAHPAAEGEGRSKRLAEQAAAAAFMAREGAAAQGDHG
jgi:ribonuclease-3